MAKNPLRNSLGMTLMEILIVMGIIGALLATLIPQVMDKFQKSKVSSTKLSMNKLMNDINLYYTDCGKYPESLDNLMSADASCSNWGPEPYTKKLPKDAWNGNFIYSLEGNNFVLKSLGKDGREGGDGYNKDLTSEDLQ